jgi:hypothetical protein
MEIQERFDTSFVFYPAAPEDGALPGPASNRRAFLATTSANGQCAERGAVSRSNFAHRDVVDNSNA